MYIPGTNQYSHSLVYLSLTEQACFLNLQNLLIMMEGESFMFEKKTKTPDKKLICSECRRVIKPNSKYTVIRNKVYCEKCARKKKDWKKSDELRDTLKAAGYIVEDSKQGQKIRKNV